MESQDRLVRTLGVVLGTALAVSAAAWPAVPEPAEGRRATTTVALLRHSHQRCTGAADRLLAHWRRLRGGEGVQESLDHFVLTEATADLAAARKALDLARGLLPRATLEVDPASGAVLDRLYEADTELCNLVALPAPPLDDFQRRLDATAATIDETEAELGGRLTLPDDEQLRRQLQPYLSLIEAEASSAQQQMLEEMRPEPTPPREPTLKERMEAWHRQYAAAALPSKQALRAYLVGRQANDAAAIQKACSDLATVVLPLLSDETVFRAPDPEAREPLREIYRAMHRLSVHCTAGRFREVDVEYGRLQRQLAAAAAVLSRYGLGP